VESIEPSESPLDVPLHLANGSTIQKLLQGSAILLGQEDLDYSRLGGLYPARRPLALSFEPMELRLSRAQISEQGLLINDALYNIRLSGILGSMIIQLQAAARKKESKDGKEKKQKPVSDSHLMATTVVKVNTSSNGNNCIVWWRYLIVC
jgi:hypothetical protein